MQHGSPCLIRSLAQGRWLCCCNPVDPQIVVTDRQRLCCTPILGRPLFATARFGISLCALQRTLMRSSLSQALRGTTGEALAVRLGLPWLAAPALPELAACNWPHHKTNMR